MDFVWLIGYFRQFLSVAVAMPRMAEFCAVLHQVLMGLLYHGKLKKFIFEHDYAQMRFRRSFCNTLLAK